MPINNPTPSNANWELIETKTLGAGAASFIFENIPSGYSWLWLIGVFENNNSNVTLTVTTNNTATQQLSNYIRTVGTTVTGASNTQAIIETATFNATDLCALDFKINNSAALYKTGVGILDGGDACYALSCQVKEVAEINTITFTCSANFHTSLRMQLYGMK